MNRTNDDSKVSAIKWRISVYKRIHSDNNELRLSGCVTEKVLFENNPTRHKLPNTKRYMS